MTALSKRDESHLRAAFRVALRAREEGNLPFGCLIVDGEDNVAVEQGNIGLVPVRDATGHAETTAVRRASQRWAPPELASFTLYTSAEPCAMCAGAVYWSGIGRVVFGLRERDLKALTGNHPDNPTMDLPCREVFARGQRKVEVLGPNLEEEALAVFDGYWTSPKTD